MRIFIPTYRRGPARQFTIRELGPLADKYRATLVCPPDEVKELTKAGFRAEACRAKGISATRQWIIDRSDDPIVLMLDDDLQSWCSRRECKDGKVGYTVASPKERQQAFAEFEKLMRKYAHGGIGHRLFANNRDRIDFNTRLLRALAYNRDVMREERVKFRLPVMEDFDVQLQLLKRGHECVQFNGITHEQPGSNVNGGCSEYRTHEVQADAAKSLAKLHPDCVKVVEKELKVGWGNGMEGTRVDVRVSWRTALRVGKEYRNARG